MNEMTERQVKSLAEYIEDAKRHNIEMDDYHPGNCNWHIRYSDEIRPGRGQDFSAVWCDGEHMVHITMDVYGHGHMGISSVNWMHGGEDCDCEVCLADIKKLEDEEDGTENEEN